MKTLAHLAVLLALASATTGCHTPARDTRASQTTMDAAPASMTVPAPVLQVLDTDGAMRVPVADDKADATKGRKPDVGAGRIAWFDLTTHDMKKSREFYGKLFGWTFTAIGGTDLAVEIVAGDVAIGSLRVAEGEISAYNGVVYVQVPDIQASCKLAKELGATIAPGFPFNLDEDRGAIGLFVDPAGHPMGTYSRTAIPPAKPTKPAK